MSRIASRIEKLSELLSLRCTMSSRRQFLAATAATITLAALPKTLFAERLGGDVYTNASLGAYAQGLLTQATFEKHTGSVFTVFLENNAVGYLTLQKVIGLSTDSASSDAASRPGLPGMLAEQHSAATIQPQITSFHLTFSTKAVFSQDTYLLDHGILGRFAAFLVPGDPVKGSGTCGATFCYLTPAASR
jgi:hypothetical protein